MIPSEFAATGAECGTRVGAIRRGRILRYFTLIPPRDVQRGLGNMPQIIAVREIKGERRRELNLTRRVPRFLSRLQTFRLRVSRFLSRDVELYEVNMDVKPLRGLKLCNLFATKSNALLSREA